MGNLKLEATATVGNGHSHGTISYLL